MRKMKLLTLLILFSLKAYCPNERVLYINQGEAIKPFKELIKAIGKVECNFDTLAYNPLEEAAGFFQIRPIRVEHYNRLTGSNYQLSDMYDYDKAEKVFLYFADRIGPYDMERVAKSWNGSGPKTVKYWNLVKQQL